MNFAQVLQLLLPQPPPGAVSPKFTRPSWPAKPTGTSTTPFPDFILAVWPNPKSPITAPMLEISSNGTVSPYIPSQADIFATDWTQIP